MVHTRRLAACTAVISALAIPAATAGAVNPPPPVWTLMAPAHAAVVAPLGPFTSPTIETVSHSSQGNPDPACPAGYNGPTNLATGCPWYLMR